eukprot:g31882.t1
MSICDQFELASGANINRGKIKALFFRNWAEQSFIPFLIQGNSLAGLGRVIKIRKGISQCTEVQESSEQFYNVTSYGTILVRSVPSLSCPKVSSRTAFPASASTWDSLPASAAALGWLPQPSRCSGTASMAQPLLRDGFH